MDNAVMRYRAFGDPVQQLRLEWPELQARPAGWLRVAMSLVPVNPSDLIPVTGAYAHRIRLPAIAGYEGVGTVIDAPPECSAWLGRRVLPLRCQGTWQRFVDCDPALAVDVPDDIDDVTAARAYINPLAALCMLRRWPVHGKHVLLTGAGSTCANLLGLWARREQAAAVTGIHRSHGRVAGMRRCGVEPLHMQESTAIRRAAAHADIVFDALGGPLATSIIEAMRADSTFVGYGLLSGRPLAPARPPRARYRRFHLRDELAGLSSEAWQRQFRALWPRLREPVLPRPRILALAQWRRAIECFDTPGRDKPMLDMQLSASTAAGHHGRRDDVHE